MIIMNILRSIATYGFAGLVMVFALPYLWYIERLKTKIGEKPALIKLNKLVNSYARVIVKLSGAKVELAGLENLPTDDTTAVYVGNHQSNFDIPIVVACIKQAKAFVVKDELRKIPVIRHWIHGLNCVFIARGEGRKALEAISKGSKIVKAGYSMVIFPEGTRSPDGQLGEFKAGSLKLAVKGGAMVVPFAIEGTRDVMPRNKAILQPAKIKLTILPPIPAEEVVNIDTKVLAHRVKSAIAQELGQKVAPLEDIAGQ